MRILSREIAIALDGVEPALYANVLDLVRMSRSRNKTFYFIGNGGSAAIASHMAADWLKNGGMRAQCFSDGPLLTCLSNDLGYERSFSVPLHRFGAPDDVLFAVSSSGQSQNIIEAASTAKKLLMKVVTLSGFRGDNHLRLIGHHNFYIRSMKYSAVEIAHLTILHALLDDVMADAQ